MEKALFGMRNEEEKAARWVEGISAVAKNQFMKGGGSKKEYLEIFLE
jgi:hypothetical protein